MLADVIHRKLLNSGGDWLGAEGSDAQSRHVEVGHFSCTGWICHHRLKEGRSRLKQRDLVTFDNR